MPRGSVFCNIVSLVLEEVDILGCVNAIGLERW